MDVVSVRRRRGIGRGDNGVAELGPGRSTSMAGNVVVAMIRVLASWDLQRAAGLRTSATFVAGTGNGLDS